MTDHYATPAEWKSVQDRASLVSSDSCLLELRARVELLERRPQDKLDRLIAQDAEEPEPQPMKAVPGVAIEPPELDSEQAFNLWHGPGSDEPAVNAARRIHRAGWDAAMAAVATQQRQRQEPAPCPHIRSSDEGSSYCALAESNSQPTPNNRQIRNQIRAAADWLLAIAADLEEKQ